MLWRGDLDQATMRSRTGLAAARELGHAYTLIHVLHLNCWLQQHLGDPTTVRERAEEALNLTAEHGFSLWEQHAVFWRGWALAAAGEFTAASVQMRDAIAMFQAMGHVNHMPFKLGLLAGVHTQAGIGVRKMRCECADGGASARLAHNLTQNASPPRSGTPQDKRRPSSPRPARHHC
jgi:predicted ATPase